MKKAYLICAINPLSYQYPKTVFLFRCFYNDELSFDLNINNGQETSLLVFGICPNSNLYHEENIILNNAQNDY